jgi:hypothetical protein
MRGGWIDSEHRDARVGYQSWGAAAISIVLARGAAWREDDPAHCFDSGVPGIAAGAEAATEIFEINSELKY